MNKFDKKSLIIVISSVLLIVIVSAVSFAFLGSFKKQLNNVDVNIIAENVNNTYFNVTNNVSFALDVDPSMMSEASNGTYVAENTATLDVSINPALNGLSVKCTYDIIFEYDSSSNIYGVSPTPVTSGADKELTLQISGPNGTSDYFEEKNFNLTSRSKTVVSGAEIINSISGMPTTHRWKFVNRFYNLNLDQSALANKSFKGKYYVANVSCDKYEDKTIYSLVKNRYKNSDKYVKLYSESDASTYANPVYYFNGAVENNNVLFGDFCWKMVRTTDTGGVKIVYSGRPTTDDDTLLNQSEYVNLINDTSYPYTYDETNKTWTSTNTGTNSSTISFTAPSNGDYVINYDLSMDDWANYIYVEIFKDNVSQGEFTGTTNGQIVFKDLATSNVIKIVYTRKYNFTSGDRNNVIFSFGKANSIICNNTGTNSQIGTSRFNSSNSPAYVGYMYNTVYTSSSKELISELYFNGTKAYADSVIYDSSIGKYTLDSTTAKILNVTTSDVKTLIGKYTCNSSSTTETCTNVYYIVGYSGYYIFYYLLSNGDVDGTDNGSDYVFGSSFTYANGTYTLNSTTTINTDDWATKKSTINTHHYTCFTDGTTCTALYYVYYINIGTPYYITLTNGKSVDDALNEMLYADDVNKNDSTMKAYIDSWYKDNMTSYTDKLEDTIFCNDRSMYNESSNGWNPNGGSTGDFLEFKNFSSSNKSLVCINETDRFSVNNPKAQLKYPIGLLTVPELRLAGYGSSHYFNNGQYVWLGSPYYFTDDDGFVSEVHSDGLGFGWLHSLSSADGVRPAVSLKPGTEYTTGDGSYTSPFIVD